MLLRYLVPDVAMAVATVFAKIGLWQFKIADISFHSVFCSYVQKSRHHRRTDTWVLKAFASAAAAECVRSHALAVCLVYLQKKTDLPVVGERMDKLKGIQKTRTFRCQINWCSLSWWDTLKGLMMMMAIPKITTNQICLVRFVWVLKRIFVDSFR